MSRLAQSDRGATAITLAIMMIVIMGIAAVAIDLGLGFSERRLDQIGADTAVMAAAVEFASGGQAQDVVDQVKTYVDTNVRPVSDADWEACIDPEPLEISFDTLAVTPATNCISIEFTEDEDRIRVRLPDQEIDTAFSALLGVRSLTIQAEAESIFEQFPGEQSSPPFVALSGAGPGDQICLRTNSSGPEMPPLMEGTGGGAVLGTTPDPCDDEEYDPLSQFFGTLDPKSYFNNQTGELTCKSNLTDYSIALGIDHPLDSFDPDFVLGSVRPDTVEDDCAPDPAFGVNTMPLKTGLDAQDLRCGMLTTNGGGCVNDVPPGSAGGNNVPARLHIGPQGGNTFLGESMNNDPLWFFMLDTNPGTWPAACDSLHSNRNNNAWDYFDKKDELIACLSSPWTPASGQLFKDSIAQVGRFAWIPQLAESNMTTDPSACAESGGKCVHFNEFLPIYMQTLYTLITGGNAGDCDVEERTGVAGNTQRWGRHDAGEPINCGKSNANLDRVSSLVLDCRMLSDDICNSRPGTPGGDPVPVFELVK